MIVYLYIFDSVLLWEAQSCNFFSLKLITISFQQSNTSSQSYLYIYLCQLIFWNQTNKRMNWNLDMCSVFKQNYEKHIVVVFLIDLRNICVVFLLFVYTVRKASSNCKKFLSLHPFDNITLTLWYLFSLYLKTNDKNVNLSYM